VDDRPRITIENCHTLAAECCAYYAHILNTYNRPNRDPHWHQMRDVAETWRRLLDCDSAPETDIEELEQLIQPMWAADQCATIWIYMATGIRSRSTRQRST
jgi:hypothetical protein